MKAEENKNEIEKTQVFNLIILDRSGSMELIREAAIEGFNRTLAGIKKAQEKYADTQDHYVSLVTFCGCGIDDVFYRTPVSETRPLTMEDYRPCCNTPLYDAVVTTLISLYYRVWNIDDSVASLPTVWKMLHVSMTARTYRNLLNGCAWKGGHSPIWEPIKTLLRWPRICLSVMHATLATTMREHSIRCVRTPVHE